jgi:hypothetical protein
LRRELHALGVDAEIGCGKKVPTSSRGFPTESPQRDAAAMRPALSGCRLVAGG